MGKYIYSWEEAVDRANSLADDEIIDWFFGTLGNEDVHALTLAYKEECQRSPEIDTQILDRWNEIQAEFHDELYDSLDGVPMDFILEVFRYDILPYCSDLLEELRGDYAEFLTEDNPEDYPEE